MTFSIIDVYLRVCASVCIYAEGEWRGRCSQESETYAICCQALLAVLLLVRKGEGRGRNSVCCAVGGVREASKIEMSV